MTERRARKGLGTVVTLPDGRFRGQADFGRINGKRQRPVTETVATYKEAARLLKALIAKGPKLPEAEPEQTVGEWVTYWCESIASQTLRAGTLEGYRSKIRLYILPGIGATRLTMLTAEHLEHLYAQMRKAGKSQATIRQTHAIIRRALVVAVRRGRLDKNVAEVIELGAAPANPHHVHTADECLRILGVARDVREAARLHVALSCGLRQSEALALDWTDIHETDPHPWLYVHRTVTGTGESRTVIEATKTAKSRRSVFLTPAAASMLAAWRHQSGGVGLVFPAGDGQPLTAKVDSNAWHRAEDRAGVPRMPLHGARGALASRLYEGGVPLEVAAEILGHSSTETTRRHYLHIGSAQHQAAMLALDRATQSESASIDSPPTVGWTNLVDR